MRVSSLALSRSACSRTAAISLVQAAQPLLDRSQPLFCLLGGGAGLYDLPVQLLAAAAKGLRQPRHQEVADENKENRSR